MNRPWNYTQMPDLRQFLIDQWASAAWRGGLTRLQRIFKAGMVSNSTIEMADTERNLLKNASLWWVSPPMCDLLYGTMLAVPSSVTANDLKIPYDSGLIFLEEPWTQALDAQSGTRTVRVDAVCWGRTNVLSEHAPPMPCISLSSYRYLDLGGELTPSEAILAQVYQNLPETLSKRNAIPAKTGAWIPLGRSDWPIGQPLNEPITNPYKTDMITNADAFNESIKEDRQLIATFWTLIASPSMAQVQSHEPSRQVKRQAARHNKTPPGAVNIIYLRKPKNTKEQNETEHIEYSHRFVVRAHPVLQAYGPGRSQRRLIIRGPYIKGPESKPLIIKDSIHVWTK